MTAPDVVELGRRAVACGGFPEFDDIGETLTVYPKGPNGEDRLRDNDGIAWLAHANGERTPDFNDPATLGALLGLVREAWGDKIEASVGAGWWEVWTDQIDEGRWDHESTPSFAAALVCALEAAPVRS